MYVPHHFEMTADASLDLAAAVGVGHLVTVTDGRIDSTFLPFLIDRGPNGTVVRAHLAIANAQRHAVTDRSSALLIVHGPDSYVSPGVYPSKREHGKVVPTWNYALVHLRGRLEVIDESDQLRTLVSDLTDLHERDRDQPWAVDDAPSDFIDLQLKAIVGLELHVTEVEGKAKLSQNRAEPDRSAVRAAFVDGTTREREVGEMMA